MTSSTPSPEREERERLETDYAVHPGGTLKEVLADTKLSQKVAATALGVSEQYLSDVIGEKRGISPELAHRLGRLFGPSEQFWLRYQANYEADVARIRRQRRERKVQP